MPRGRSKQPKAYSNRTDLNGPVPASAPTGMPYGENKKLMDAQRAVPMGTPEAPKPEATPQAMPSATPPPPVVPLTEPTQFPNESITTGLPAPAQQIDPDVARLKSYLPLFKQEAATANAPTMFRDFVKWLDNL